MAIVASGLGVRGDPWHTARVGNFLSIATDSLSNTMQQLSDRSRSPDMSHDQLVDSVLGATRSDPRRDRTLRLARSVSVVLGSVQIAIAIPDLLLSPHHNEHSQRHVAAFAIAIGVGLIYAGLRPHRATGLIAPLLALTASLIVTCAVDIANGRWPSELDIHLISPVAVGVLWGVAHFARPAPTRAPSRQLESVKGN